MRLSRTLFIALLFFSPSGPVLAWAPEGHQVAAAIALRELTPAARARVASLLGGEAMMVLDSSWADEIRGQRPETLPWQYVNIPIGSRGYDARLEVFGTADAGWTWSSLISQLPPVYSLTATN